VICGFNWSVDNAEVGQKRASGLQGFVASGYGFVILERTIRRLGRDVFTQVYRILVALRVELRSARQAKAAVFTWFVAT
jgi:hypothetical protein